MKKAIIVSLFLIFLGTFFAVRSDAAESREYIIRGEDGGYTLYLYSDGVPIKVSTGELEELIGKTSGGRLTLDGVESYGRIDIPEGEYVLSGSLSSKGSFTLHSGTRLTLSEASVSFTDEYGILVRGGELFAQGATVSSERGAAIVLDYSATSRFVMTDTAVITVSSEATILLKSGAAELLSGEVINGGGAAVISDSSLTLGASLSGIGNEIITDKPFHISEGFCPESVVRISYGGNLRDGTLTELIYGARGESVAYFSLTNKDGREEKLTYFDSHKTTSSSNFLAVYKPYTVRAHFGSSVTELEYLEGETVVLPKPNSEEGYMFSGWYLDREYSSVLATNASVTADMDVYAGFTLIPPTFRVTTLDFVYDGKDRELTVDDLFHPLDSSGGSYGYVWERGGEEIGRGSFINVSEVSDSGYYTCIITFRHGVSEVTVRAENISVKVEPATVSLPTVTPIEYTGAEITPNLPYSPHYTAEITGGISAGKYPIRLILKDPYNYRFENSEEKEANIYYRIVKAENSWQSELTVQNAYEGCETKVSASSRFGEVKYLYSSSEGGAYTHTPPSAVGIYYVIARVEGTGDYTELVSAPTELRILADSVDRIYISEMPRVTDYRAFESFIPDGLIAVAVYRSGREESVTAERLKISYQQGESFLYGDVGVIITYLGVSTTCEVNVERAAYDVSELKFSSTSTVFNATYQSVSPPTHSIMGIDGIPLIMSVSGGGVNVGEYSVTLSFSTDSANYTLPDPITVKLVIAPYTANITWQKTQFVYDGNLCVPVATYVDVHGAIRYATVSGGAINAGKNYIATASVSDPNYLLSSTECSFSILRADYILDSVEWSETVFSYTGEPLSVTISGLPEGLSVIGYIDASATDAGEYTARAVFSYDSVNYNPPPCMTHKWRIDPIPYDDSGYSFADTRATYDGEVHYPTFTGNMPTGIDGCTLSYSFSCGATHVNEGVVAVTVAFASESKNYLVPPPMTVYVEILPQGITVTWTEDELVYTGKPLAPSAYSPITDVSVGGEAVNAGAYVAVCSSLNDDYFVINSEQPFTVNKAHNYWTVSPSISDIYEGYSPSPVCEAIWGQATYFFYSDPDCTVEAYPSGAGVYYAIAAVPESENYLPLISSPIRFCVMEVLPIGLSAALLSDSLTAFTRVTDEEVSLHLCYNDGTSRRISLSEAAVSYQSADSLRRSDTKINLSYGVFSVELPLSVGYASYDLSAVSWSDDVFLYDSLPKLPTLSGLPLGVSVKGYSISPVTNAGTYSVEAYLEYDVENYLMPVIPAHSFNVLPCTVPCPRIESREYDGSYYVPTSPSDLYAYSEITPERFVGEYTLYAELTDPVNYVFEDGTVSQRVTYLITPKVLTFTVSDFDLYLWESEITPHYVMTDGEAVAGDDLMLRIEVTDGIIALRSDNPNYELSVTVGKVNSLGYPSPETTAMIIIVTLLSLAFTLFAIVVYSERERILDCIAVIRYRFSRIKHTSEVHREESGVGRSLGGVPTYNNEENYSACDPEYCPEAPVYEDDRYEEADEEPTISKDQCTYDAESAERDLYGHSDGYGSISESNHEEPSPEDKLLYDVEAIDSQRADVLITDSLAKNLVKRSPEIIFTEGEGRSVINVDTLSRNFSQGDRVDVNVLKKKCLVPYDTAYLKVLARGVLDKSLSVYANDFSLSAVKMIALTGGESVRVITRRLKGEEGRSEKKG